MSEEYIVPLTRAEEIGRKPTRLVRAAARVAIITQWDSASKCLFVYHQTKGLELPGGAIDPDETPLQAGLRELGEEAGVILPNDIVLTLITMTPITDHRGGSWLDIIYGVVVTPVQISMQQEAELPISWLTANEIEDQVDKGLSSYKAALMFLKK
jgi:8-oxo-dGTP pyrophosphatase MutT (NUDIX family)